MPFSFSLILHNVVVNYKWLASRTVEDCNQCAFTYHSSYETTYMVVYSCSLYLWPTVIYTAHLLVNSLLTFCSLSRSTILSILYHILVKTVLKFSLSIIACIPMWLWVSVQYTWDHCWEKWQMTDLNVKFLWAQMSLWHFHLGAVASVPPCSLLLLLVC